jgi:hypothetical protein
MDTRVVASGKVTVQDSEQGICYRLKLSPLSSPLPAASRTSS